MAQPRFITFMERNDYAPEDFSAEVQNGIKIYQNQEKQLANMDEADHAEDVADIKLRMNTVARNLFSAMMQEKGHELSHNQLPMVIPVKSAKVALEKDMELLERLVKSGHKSGLLRSFLLHAGLSFDPVSDNKVIGRYRLVKDSLFFYRYRIAIQR